MGVVTVVAGCACEHQTGKTPDLREGDRPRASGTRPPGDKLAPVHPDGGREQLGWRLRSAEGGGLLEVTRGLDEAVGQPGLSILQCLPTTQGRGLGAQRTPGDRQAPCPP